MSGDAGSAGNAVRDYTAGAKTFLAISLIFGVVLTLASYVPRAAGDQGQFDGGRKKRVDDVKRALAATNSRVIAMSYSVSRVWRFNSGARDSKG